MIEIAVVDSSAEERNKLAERIIRFQTQVQQKNPTCPQLSVRVLSLQELPFTEQPDICVIGAECLSNDLVEIATIRTHLPEARLIADCPDELSNLVIIEQMGRLGVEDVINPSTTAEEFFKKIVLLNKRTRTVTSGKLVVFDSGKGGVGTTSIVAATATTLFNQGMKVAIIDLDCETQDLTRFLSVRPVINENLALMLSQERGVVKEFVQQAVVPIWGHQNLVCVPPVTHSLQALPARSPMIRTFLAFLEQLDHLFDIILVDVAGTRGALYHSLIRVADSVVFVTNPEPAAMFATTQIIKETLRLSPHPDAIKILQNAVAPGGMYPSLVKVELCRSLKLHPSQCLENYIPYDRDASKWPGSGQSMDFIAKRKLEKRFFDVVSELGLLKDSPQPEKKTTSFGVLSKVLKSRLAAFIERSSVNSNSKKVQKSEDILLPQISTVSSSAATSRTAISLPVFENETKEF